jgi:hypothetical protein
LNAATLFHAQVLIAEADCSNLKEEDKEMNRVALQGCRGVPRREPKTVGGILDGFAKVERIPPLRRLEMTKKN